MHNNIKDLRKAAGLTQDQVAKALDLHLTNYNRLENGKTEITDRRIYELAEIFSCAPEAILFEQPPATRIVSVKCHVQAGAWSESNEWPPDDWYNVPIPDDEDWRGTPLFGAEARGPSMDKVYPEGTVIVFTTSIGEDADIIPGKRYIVEIERADGLREATVKQLWQDEAGKYWLLPESTDPRFQEAIALNGDEGDTIRLKGRVVYSVRRE